MLPATTLPAAVPAGQDAAVSAVCAGPGAAPQPPAVSRTSWRDHRKTPPRDGDAALAELRAMGSLWRGAGGGIRECPGTPHGSAVTRATAGDEAPCPAQRSPEELRAMGSLGRGAGGVIEEGPVPPEGIVVIGARPGAYAPGLAAAAGPRAAGPVTRGTGRGSPAGPKSE